MASKEFNTKSELEKLFLSADYKERLRDAKTPGLFVQKGQSKSSWNFSYRFNGSRKTYTIGPYPNLTLTIARQTVRQLQVQISQHIDPQLEKRKKREVQTDTILAYLEGPYSDYLKTKKSGKQTKQTIKKHFRLELKRPFSSLNRKTVTHWHYKILKTNLHDTTILRAYKSFKALINHAVKNEHIQSNPIANVHLEKVYRESQGIRKPINRTYLTPKQFEQLLHAVELFENEKRQQRANSIKHGKPWLKQYSTDEYFSYFKPVILFAIYTGMRPGDIRTLRWEHIIFSSTKNYISKKLSKTGNLFKMELPDEALKVLSKWRNQHGNPEKGLIFHNNGNELSKWFMRRPWQRILKLADLPDDIHFYNLRHSFASYLIMSGADLMTVAELMGHTSIKMVEEHYGHLSPEHKANSLNKAIASMGIN